MEIMISLFLMLVYTSSKPKDTEMCLNRKCITWINFSVAPDAVGVNDVLKAGGELVSLVERRWSLLCLHPV